MNRVNAHLARIGAVSRPTGSAACDDARSYCAEVLTGLGFVVREHSFEYSQFAGKWAAPLTGIGVPSIATVWFASHGMWWPTTVALGIWLFIIVIAGDITRFRATGVNLRATRGGEPSVWLVAHIDSKWQPVSMLLRVAGVILLTIGVISVFASVAVHARMTVPWLVITWLGALPLMLSLVGERNHGTLDNASGVAAVLDAAALIARDCPIGVMITDAEELALAGARAWAREASPAIALNCDSVDDDGSLVVMYSGRSPDEIVSRLRAAASTHGEPLRVMRLVPGILTDHVALANASWRTVTLSRGTIRTLQRIHTSRDTLAHMSGRGIAGAAQVLARVATELAGCK